MTVLSVNLNKIALLRNSRGRDYPNVVEFARKFYRLGVRGITIHPRQDERHITRQDAVDLGRLVGELEDMELNIEGYPSADFLDLVERVKPDQCTLVPDSPDQLTSDHGWDMSTQMAQVRETCSRLSDAGIRSAIFIDPDAGQIRAAPESGTRRIELYTEEYAATRGSAEEEAVFKRYRDAAILAQQVGLEVNAGHDLDLSNLARFLQIDGILEVSIGHASAVAVATDALDHLQPTAASHSRVMVLEVMGRDAGHIALSAGIAGGADVILIPEIPYRIAPVAAKIDALKQRGRNFALVVVSEAVKTLGGAAMQKEYHGGEKRFGGIGDYLSERIAAATGAESRVTVLGHVQRGSSPSWRDRLLATSFGVHAVDLIAEGKYDRMVAWSNRQVVDVALEEAIADYQAVELDGTLVKTARGLGIYIGDESDG